MRDFLLNEALKRLAGDAAVRLSALVAGGAQIPFDVGEQPGPDSLFHSYEPLTGRFVHQHEDEIRELPSFVQARNAIDAAGVAIPYLESRGEQVPTDPRARAERLLIVFTASLWEGCTEFSLDRERLERAIEALDAEAREPDEAETLVVPVVGLKMDAPSIELPHGVRLIRADMVEAPIDAMRSEGMGRAAWEPQYLAVAEQGEAPESAAEALHQLRELISVMRLYKAGGIGLGPYAFAPTAGGRWTRLPTGAPAARPGGYTLSAEEAGELAALATELEARPDPDGALSWAVARFEMGCCRETSMEGLSDHLLALRAVLEGHGPVGASLPMRASALVADESCDRIEARGKVEDALELERGLMNGAPSAGSLHLAIWLEDGVRRLLREAAMGALGTDLGTAADESLIASGLAEGDAEISVSVVADMEPEISAEIPDVSPEASKASPGTPGREAEDVPVDGEVVREPDDDHDLIPSEEGSRPASSLHSSPEDLESLSLSYSPREEDEMDLDQETRIMEPIPAEGEIRISEPALNGGELGLTEPVPAEDEIRITATNWLDEVSARDGTMEWSAAESDIGHRERVDSPRVRHLFPVPEDADWEVRELNYDHYRHAG